MHILEKVVKKNVKPFKVWLGPLLIKKTLLKTAQLFSKHFFPLSFFVSFISFIVKETKLLQRLSIHHLVYVFPIFFRFHKCFNNLHLISLQISFFTVTCVSLYFYFHGTRELLVSFWSNIISLRLISLELIKKEMFPFYSHW